MYMYYLLAPISPADFDGPDDAPSLPSIGPWNSIPEAGLPAYPMTREPRGLCLIINNMNFPKTNLTERRGSDVDAGECLE